MKLQMEKRGESRPKFSGRILLSCMIFVMVSVFLTGCKPPLYSEAHRKAVTEEKSHYAEEWFEKNMPEAKVKSATAYADKTNLYQIISGEYRKGSKKYRYMYDCVNHVMYLNEQYADVCAELDSLLEQELKGEKDVLEITYSGLTIEAVTDNDRERTASETEANRTCSIEIDMLPAGIDVKTYAKECLYSEDSFTIFASVYTDKLEDNNAEKALKYKGIDVLSFTALADYDNNGVVEEVYYPDRAMGARKTWLKLIQADGKDYVGFAIDVNEPELYKEEENREEKLEALYKQLEEYEITYEKLDSKNYKLSIPGGASPIVLSNRRINEWEKVGKEKDSSTGYGRYFISPAIIRLPDKGLTLFYKKVYDDLGAGEHEFSYK